MRDDKQQQLKIELLSQWKLEAESRNFVLFYSAQHSTNRAITQELYHQLTQLKHLNPQNATEQCNVVRQSSPSIILVLAS